MSVTTVWRLLRPVDTYLADPFIERFEPFGVGMYVIIYKDRSRLPITKRAAIHSNDFKYTNANSMRAAVDSV